MLTVGLVVSACTDDPTVEMADYQDLDGPMVVATDGDDDLTDRWTALAQPMAHVDRAGEEAEAIPGFEPFNDPRIALADGRFLVRRRL